ncbi:hypothetical protein D8I30_09045 [Brevundimonas naejangsanensis]|uniref:Uncharacterized protein n=1 Tax=Brevundimonas naejangsanensis TaxID=588932 RepID=A0A494RIR9_9CAUL|nr:hypothetical protein [Brevundimonas naejangsanensis]AYG95309.1 hypothetical protein D8I30_09045 [Brevundimonas naejangsanensis]
MDQQFNVVDEVRKHPGIAAGVVAVLAGVGLAALLLNQRSGPTRYERLKTRMDPRGWFDAEALRHRFDDIARGVRHRGDDESGRAADPGDYFGLRTGRFGAETRHRADEWLRRAKRKSRKPMRRYARQARRYAEDAGDFARDHAKEGGALLAMATIAAAIGAAALDSRRRGDGLRGLGKI